VPETPASLASFTARGFFPADYAAVESDKVYTSGGYWSTLRFPQFPAVLPACSLVAVIEIPFHANQADHTLRMGLIGPDNEPMQFKVEGLFRTAPKIEQLYGEPGSAAVAVPVQGLTFERPGKYNFTLAVDDREISRYSFTVVHSTLIPVR